MEHREVGDFERMATEAPGWADQWGAGGIGKAKVAAMAGAEKIKNGTSNGIKWIKNQCQKKKPSKPVN
ncbi:hypothetical protein Pyn_03460 [Prunus yedoensis var. nudiflora]|uniref:Uncharacterized protein n=1 Tax=Prunus yedoensis var. nudiflora TaxID=2094558 RepID=A0A314YGT8_PRUYE|nr:hypothetical protein Pyn_03460 [Prunus yedoensis var. nudiflora]